MKKVNKEEFDNFITNYENPLTTSVIRICSPPIQIFSDDSLETKFKIGSWEYSRDKEVAMISMDWLGPNGEMDYDGEKYWEYSLKGDKGDNDGKE